MNPFLGRRTKVVEPSGLVTSYTYDNCGNVLTETVTGKTNGKSLTTKYTYDLMGRMVSAVDAQGAETKYEYDGDGNLLKVAYPEGTTEEYEYDAVGNTKKYKDAAGQTTSVTDEMGNTYEVVYDEFGNVTVMTDCMGNVVTRNNYDAYNRLLESYDAEGGKISYVYDKVGRLINMVEAVGTTNASDSVNAETNARTNETTQSSSNQYAVTEYSYENGRLKSVTDPEDGVSSYTYDSRGNIQAVTDPMGNVTKYAYDSMNRVKTVTNALNVVTSYTYNADGLLEEEVNGREQKRSYKYDALGRVIEIKDEAGTISYTYDANGNVLTVKDKQGTIKRTYDALNRVKTYTDYNGNTITYGYDEMGNRISLTYPGGEIVRYTYDKCGNLETVTDAKGRVTKYTYTKNGKVESITRPDGSCESYEYDTAGRVVEATDKKGNQLIHHYQYTYDLQGNITNIEKHGTEEGKGDLSTVTNTTMTYTADNRLDTFNGQKVTYDADGNMTYGPLNGVMTAFIYDCRNRLIKAGDTIYEYDAENTRIAIQTKEKREEYVVDKNTIYSQVLSITTYEKNLLGQFAKEKDYTVYTYGIGLISQERTTTQTSETTGAKSVGTGEYYLYHYNQIGSTTQITDMEGKVIYTYTYSAYGERTGTYDADGNIIDDNSTKVRFLYNGQAGVETDENGLYYMRARYYNTDIKRFINRDIVDGTIQNSQSLNKYSYVQGNPISLTDPFGLCPEGSGINDYLKLIGHTLLDIAGFIPVVGFIPDLVNAYWYHCEKNPTMAMASVISAIPGLGDFAGVVLKGIGLGAKCSKLVKAADVVIDTCRFTGAVAQTGLNIQNTKIAWNSVVDEYQSTGKVSFLNAGNLALSAFGVGMGAKLSTGYANKFAKKYGINGKRIWNYLRYDNRGMVDLSYFKKSGTGSSKLRDTKNIRYSQNDIDGTFEDGTNVNSLIYHLKNSPEYAMEIEPIRLVKYNDLPSEVQQYLSKQGVSSSTVFSLDNRRLYAAKQAGVKVNSVWATQSDLSKINLRKRFSTVTGGKSIEIR